MRTSLSIAMQYRSDFLFEGLTGILRTLATVAALGLVYVHRTEVAGWTMPEAMLVMALFLVMSSLVEALFEPNLGAVVEAIRNGSLDLLLMKPADAQLLVSAMPRTVLTTSPESHVGRAAAGSPPQPSRSAQSTISPTRPCRTRR